MLYSVFAVYDTGIQTWMPPIYARNKGEMLRQFVDAVNNPESKIAKYPADFVLFELGTWNDESADFSLLASPVKMGIAIEFMKHSTFSDKVVEMAPNK